MRKLYHIPKRCYDIGHSSNITSAASVCCSSAADSGCTLYEGWNCHENRGAFDGRTEWAGRVQAPHTGTFTFYTLVNDGARLWVNGQQLVDSWVNRDTAAELSGNIALESGQKYDIRLEYYDNTGGAQAKLSWSSSQISKEVVPYVRLFADGYTGDVSAAFIAADLVLTKNAMTPYYSDVLQVSYKVLYSGKAWCRFNSGLILGDSTATKTPGVYSEIWYGTEDQSVFGTIQEPATYKLNLYTKDSAGTKALVADEREIDIAGIN
ncbi:MAG: hypothetical protein GF398_17435 [Chitinivibrionales bacterium]|nr:hypothetical protein [Chitinivibrionales bacterium]